MKLLPLFLLLLCAAGLYLPWLQADSGAIVLRDPQLGFSLEEAPRSVNLLAAEDGPILLGVAGAAFLFLLLGLALARKRWPRILAFLLLAALATFCWVDVQEMRADSALVKMGDYIFSKPRSVGLGAWLSTSAAALAALASLVSVFRR